MNRIYHYVQLSEDKVALGIDSKINLFRTIRKTFFRCLKNLIILSKNIQKKWRLLFLNSEFQTYIYLNTSHFLINM